MERGTLFRKGRVDSPLGQGGVLSTSICRWWSDLCLKNTDGAEIQLNHLGNRVNSGINYLSTGSSFWPATERNAIILSMYQKMFRISQESRSSPKDLSFLKPDVILFFSRSILYLDLFWWWIVFGLGLHHGTQQTIIHKPIWGDPSLALANLKGKTPWHLWNLVGSLM